MSRDRALTESRLHEALKRLLNDKPNCVKAKGKLTLNKVNNEAGLGNSYVHKFKNFVEYAKPIIEDYNNKKQKAIEEGYSVSDLKLSELDKLRSEKLREQRLKEKYKQERDDARKAKVALEALNNTLMYRLYELQEELTNTKGAVVTISNEKY